MIALDRQKNETFHLVLVQENLIINYVRKKKKLNVQLLTIRYDRTKFNRKKEIEENQHLLDKIFSQKFSYVKNISSHIIH